VAALYDSLLAGSDLVLPVARPGHVYHTYTVRAQQRDALQAKLAAAGIQTAIHYPAPAHLQPAYQHFGNGAGSMPEAEGACAEVLSLPIYPEMTDAAVREVADCILG
jgi:Predicted pyridoxal phosphate-dependent enzyme apparently involved in regulation of cell wall biogenesis